MWGMNQPMTEPAAPDHTVDAEQTVPDFPPTSAAMPSGTPPERGGRRRRPLGVVAITMLVALLGFAGGIAGFLFADEYLAGETIAAEGEDRSDEGFQPTNDEPSAQSDPAPANDDRSGTKTPRQVYRDVAPSVAHISSTVVTEADTGFFGLPGGEPEESEGTGSGFVIDDKGHIVTNAHVVNGADKITVSFGTEATDVPAKLIGADSSSDIAVIKVDPDSRALRGLDLKPVPFGDSSRLQVGDPVLAIGNPFGLDRTLTTGVVSALQREIPALNEGFEITDVIQTDAAVNPGNSGGPLLDAQGRVIGVNSQIQSRTGSFAGIAFAVPSGTVQDVADELIREGKVEYAWLGVAGRDVTPQVAEELDLPVDEGVLIGTVTPGSPADKAGLEGSREVRDLGSGETSIEGGDVMLRFGGEQLESMRELADLVADRDPGDKVEVEYVHDGKRRTATVTLGERPEEIAEE